MLKEQETRQADSESPRRWFSDDSMDLIVWLDENSTVVGFQLCYDLLGNEKALTWKRESGFAHSNVDAGESSADKNLSPILEEEGEFPKERVFKYFQENSLEIDPGLREVILEKLNGFGSR